MLFRSNVNGFGIILEDGTDYQKNYQDTNTDGKGNTGGNAWLAWSNPYWWDEENNRGVFAVAFASCSDDDDNTPAIKFNPSTVSVAVGGTKNVKVAGGDGIYTAKSSDDKTATVTVDKATITVKGVKAGKATVLVTDSKKVTGSLRITVVDGVVVDKAKTSIAVGKEDVVNISGGTTPYTAASKDDKIATATVKDAKLTIKGVKVGSTTITITDKNKKTATVVVTVTK